MKFIDESVALDKIKNMGISNIIEWDSLNYMIQENEKAICCEGDNYILFLNKDENADHITVIPTCDSALQEEVFEFITDNCSKPNILVNTTGIGMSNLELLHDRIESIVPYYSTITDYAYISDAAKLVSLNVRLLNSDDREAFLNLKWENTPDRPPLSRLFELFVNKKIGSILGFFDGEKILGYLSFTKILENVLDVDYIYVDPNRRGQGVGKDLANAYIEYSIENNCLPYWSNAKNEASSNTALSCGFQLIRRVERFYKS